MKERGSSLAGAAGFASRWFSALQRCFRSSAPPVERIIIVWVHVYSNLRHRLQRTHLRAETQTRPLLGWSVASGGRSIRVLYLIKRSSGVKVQLEVQVLHSKSTLSINRKRPFMLNGPFFRVLWDSVARVSFYLHVRSKITRHCCISNMKKYDIRLLVTHV